MEILDGTRNLTQQLTYELGKSIVEGKYQVDAAFPTEAELSSHFNISRSVTREAVKMLTAKGLISSRPRKGIRVQPPNLWNMFDSDVLNWTLSAQASIPLLIEVMQLRLAIEPEAAALACEYANSEQLVLFQSFHRKAQATLSDHDALELSTQLGVAVLEASHNRFYSQFCDFIGVAKRISLSCVDLKELQSSKQFSVLQEACEAILQRRPEPARRAMRCLLNGWVMELEGLMDRERDQAVLRVVEPV